MKEFRYPTLGETWLAILREVCLAGQTIGGETRELLSVCAAFETADCETDPILAQFASSRHICEMHKVFFTSEPNQFGHSYASMIAGPLGRNDLSDVVELLAADPCTKRAVVALTGRGNGKVPCINVMHFLQREGGLLTTYFSRGQDIFQKFYADALCIFEMGQRVASRLGVPLVLVSGIISSAHVYLNDLPMIRRVLEEADGQPRTLAAHKESK